MKGYICATYADYLHWSGNHRAPTFYAIIGIPFPTLGKPASHEKTSTRVILAWREFKEKKRIVKPDWNTDRQQELGGPRPAQRGLQPETRLKWNDILTEEIIWSQIVYVLVHKDLFDAYNKVFMPLLRNQDKDSVKELALQCEWGV